MREVIYPEDVKKPTWENRHLHSLVPSVILAVDGSEPSPLIRHPRG